MNPLRVHWERIRRRWLLILLVGVVAAGASAGAVLLQPATYTARSTLTNASPDEDRKPEQDTVLAQGYADYFNQLSTQQVLRRETGADPSVEVTARLAASGPILYVEATADDAELAGDTATKMATGLRDDVNAGIENNGSAGDDPEQASNRLRDLALTAGVVENPTDAGRTAFAALVGGVLMGLLGAIALGRFESRLVTAREVHDRLGLDVLAAVRGARRGQSDAEARQQVLRSLMSLTDAHGMPRPGTLVVTGPSSTRRSQAVVATALAALRAKQGQTTLLVRADPETAGDEDPGAPGATDFLSEGTTARLGGRVRTNDHGLLICPPGNRRSGLHELYTKTQFARLFAQGTGLADLVVVDAPPIDTREGRAVCAAADRSLIVVEEGRTRAAHALSALAALGEAGATALGAVLVRDPGRLPGPGVLTEGPWHEAAPPPDMTQPLAVVAPPRSPEPTAEPVATPARTSGRLMSLLPGPLRSRGDLLVAGAAVVVVLGLAVSAPSQVGMLLAGLAIACVVGVVALSNPLLALLGVVLASFLRTAQKEIISAEALTPAFYAMLIALALALAKRAKDAPRLGYVEWMMAAYLVWNVVSALLPHDNDAVDPVSGASVEVYRWIFSGVILPFVMYVVAKSVLSDERSVRWLLWTVVGMTAYSAVIAVMQFHGPTSLVWPRFIIESPEWEGRAVGVFNQPVVNGILLVIGFVVCLFLATRDDTERRMRWALYATSVVTAYAVQLTYTRSAQLSLVVALVLGAWLARGWRKPFLVYLGLGAVAAVALAPRLLSADRSEGGLGSSNEIYDRLNIIATALKAIAEHPFVGIGIARFRLYNTFEHVAWDQTVDWNRGYGIISHQNELGIAAELGIPGLLLWLGVLLGVLWLVWRAVRELPADRFLGSPLAVVGAIAMAMFVVSGATVDMRILDFAGLLPFLFAGMVVGRLEAFRAERDTGLVGVPGAGLPGGMSVDEQIAYARDDAARGEARVPAARAATPVGRYTPVYAAPDGSRPVEASR